MLAHGLSLTVDCFTTEKSLSKTAGTLGWDHSEEGLECQVKEFRLSCRKLGTIKGWGRGSMCKANGR